MAVTAGNVIYATDLSTAVNKILNRVKDTGEGTISFAARNNTNYECVIVPVTDSSKAQYAQVELTISFDNANNRIYYTAALVWIRRSNNTRTVKKQFNGTIGWEVIG